MKKLLLFMLAIVAFAACEQAPIEEQSAVRQDAPETITVGFEGDDTRIQLNEAQKTVWTKGDLVSVFYRSNANQQWKYDGETGARTANLKRVDAGTATRDMDRVVVVYPYNEDYYINPETYNVQASLPAVQNYLKDSYGLDGNIMISSSEYNQFSLKSVCGWLKLQLTGDGETIKSIKFRGNDGEQVAGELYINSTDATAALASDMGDADDNNAGGNLVFDDTILTEVTLDCGEGVALGKNATAFYIALPPQTFESGFTVDIECDGYEAMTLSTSNALTIERNHIQPMASVEHNATPIIPNNQIWYTSSTGKVVTPYRTNVFGATIVSNTYSNGKGVITFDGDVTAIGDYAFYGCTSLTSVTIPDSVTSIGNRAFYNCISLTSVTIPDSVTAIGNYTFYYCESLTSVTIGDSVTSIGDYAFQSCRSLTSVTIPDSVTSIGDYAFQSCRSLTSVTIPDSVTTIGDYTFSYCESLKSVTIVDSVPTIGEGAFAYCTSLAEFNSKFADDNGRILVVDGILLAFAPAGLTEYTIPDSVTTIGEGVFWNCKSLSSVAIPDSVTTIGEYAFYYCTSLTNVTIGNSVTKIGRSAFTECDSLSSVTIPDIVTTIGDYAFYNCSSLTSATIGNSVMAIGNYAFAECNSLTTVNIGCSIMSIKNGAFKECDSLSSVYCKATIPPALGSDVFTDNASDRMIYVPTEYVDAYKGDTDWKTHVDNIVGYDFGDSGLVTPEIDDSWKIHYTATSKVTPYDTSAFNVEILSNKWDSTTGEGVITFDGVVETIDSYAFYMCSNLKSVRIPEHVTSIKAGAFRECIKLNDVYFNSKIESIGSGAFIACFDIYNSTYGSINIHLNSIEDWCKISMPASLVSAQETIYLKINGSTTTNITIPTTIKAIKPYAFRRCAVSTVTLHEGVESIGNKAFYDSWLENLYCKPTIPPTGGSEMFEEASDPTIYVPTESVDAYKSAAEWSAYKYAITGYDF